MSDATDDLDDLVRDLTAVENLIPRKAQQAVQQTALRTKQSWAADARRRPALRRYAPTIDYEVTTPAAFGVTAIQAEIGPDLARYGGPSGSGGLIPSLGILDDPESLANGAAPSRARVRAERFAEQELTVGIEIAVDQSMDAHKL